MKFMNTCRIGFWLACLGIYLYKFWNDFDNKKIKEVKDEGIVPLNHESKTKEDLQLTLDTVNSWVNNCDQKAGILLALVGVSITVLITSDFLTKLRNYIFTPFYEYWSNESSYLTFSWSRILVFICLLVSAIMLFASCFYLLQTISAKVDYDKMRKKHPGLVKTSFIYFGSICKMTYDDFKKDEVEYVDDLKSQIYVNSVIANKKFALYRKGLCCFKFLFLVSLMLFVAVMFVN